MKNARFFLFKNLEFWIIVAAYNNDRFSSAWILSKNILLSTAKDFYEFSQKQQLETAKRSSKDNPDVHVFYLEADEVEQAKNSYMKVRSEKIRTSG